MLRVTALGIRKSGAVHNDTQLSILFALPSNEHSSNFFSHRLWASIYFELNFAADGVAGRRLTLAGVSNHDDDFEQFSGFEPFLKFFFINWCYLNACF